MSNLLDLKETAEFKYDPNHLLDFVIKKLGIKNDAALSRRLEVAPPVISKLRSKNLPIGANMLLRLHEETDISIKELRLLMGDKRKYFRMPDRLF